MGNIINVALAALCIFIFYFVWQRQKSLTSTLSRSAKCQPPPQYPRLDPIFGLDMFLKKGKAVSENRSLPTLQESYAKMGWTFGTLSFGTTVICSIEPENLKAAWVVNFEDWGVQPTRLSAFDPFVGRGFLSTDGIEWHNSRTLLKPSLRRANIADLEPFESSLAQMISKIPKNGSTVDLQTLFFDLYLDTSCFFLFGETLGGLSGKVPPHAEGFLAAFHEALRGTGLRISLGPFKHFLPNRKWREACAITHRFADYYVDQGLEYREKLLAKKLEPSDRSKAGILLYNLVEETGDRIFLRNQILQGLIASQDTTSSLLGNVFFLLARHPDVWQKLRNEVFSVGDTLDYNTLMAMEYLQKVLKEVLRLYPVLPGLKRVALRDTVLPVGGGPDGRSPVFCAAGTHFDTSFYVLHHQARIWGPDVEEFKPDRWDNFEPAPWEYVPFAGGPRMCAGHQKATLEASYVVARMLQEFEKIESRDSRPWTGQVRLTSRNANGCLVSFT